MIALQTGPDTKQAEQNTSQAERYGGRFDERQLATKLQECTKIILDMVVDVSSTLSSLRQSCHETNSKIEATLTSMRESHRSTWGASDQELANQQMRVLTGEVSKYVANFHSKIQGAIQTIGSAAMRGGLSDERPSLKEANTELLKRTISYSADVADAVNQNYLPAESYRGSSINPLGTARSAIFERSQKLITDVTTAVLEVQRDLLGSLAINTLREADLACSGFASSFRFIELETIRSNLGESAYLPGVTEVPLTLVDQRRSLSHALSVLQNHTTQLVEQLTDPGEVQDLSSHVPALLSAHGALGAITAEMPGIFKLAEGANPSISDFACEQLAKFGEETDLKRLDAYFNFSQRSLPTEFRDPRVVAARRDVIDKLTEATQSTQDPARYVTIIERFGCEGIKAIAEILQQPQLPEKTRSVCLGALDKIQASFAGDKHMLCNKDESFRAVYREAYEAAELALNALSNAGASEDTSEFGSRVLAKVQATLADLDTLEFR